MKAKLFRKTSFTSNLPDRSNSFKFKKKFCILLKSKFFFSSECLEKSKTEFKNLTAWSLPCSFTAKLE